MLGAVLVLVASLTGVEANVETAASAAARDLAQGVEKALGKKPKLVMLSELVKAGGAGHGFDIALITELKKQGLALVDPGALRAALNEAALGTGAAESALAEVAGAFGAQVLVTGRIDQAGEALMVNARALDTRSAKVLATASTSYTAGGAASASATLEARSLQAELRRLSDTVAKGLDSLPGEVRYQRFAVLPFDEVGQNSADKQLGTLVSAELTTLLHRDHGLMLVERAQLAQVLEELALGQTGLTDPGKSVEVGKLLGAQALIVGSVSEAGDRYLVNARVVSVADAQVAFAAQAQLPAADLVALSSEAVVLRTRGGAVYRSLLLPGWGQLYNRQGEKGAIFAGAEVLSAGLAVFFHMQGQRYESQYGKLDAASPNREFLDLRQNAETSYERRRLAIIAAVAIHALNVLDALWNGRSYASAAPGATAPQ